MSCGRRIRPASRPSRWRRRTRSCWMRAATCARRPRCTGCCASAAPPGSAARTHAVHPAKKKPKLLATGPDEVWSWDITKLKGPARGIWYLLYVIMDIYSRKSFTGRPGLLRPGCWRRNSSSTPSLPMTASPRRAAHADRGTSMTSNTVARLYAKLNIAQSHSRPHVSNDNPYSESAFDTLKYCPAFPGELGSIQDANIFCEAFFTYYNIEHRSPGIPSLSHDVAPERSAESFCNTSRGCGARCCRCSEARPAGTWPHARQPRVATAGGFRRRYLHDPLRRLICTGLHPWGTASTPASRCTPPFPSTTAPGSWCRPAAPPPSGPPTRHTRNGSAASARSRSACRPGCGSTSHPQPSRPVHHHKPHKQSDVSNSLTGSATRPGPTGTVMPEATAQRSRTSSPHL